MRLRLLKSLICLMLLTLAVAGQLNFVTSPSVIIQNQQVNLTCTDPDVVSFIRENITVTNCFISSTCIFTNANNWSSIYTLSKNGTSVTVGINSVSRNRDGVRWTCRGTGGVTQTTTIDIKVAVTSVVIAHGLIFTDGQITVVTCQIGESHPPPRVTWLIDSITQPSTSITTNLNSDGTTTSIFNYLVDKSDNTKTLYCTADNNIGNPRSDSKNLDIKFPVASVMIENKQQLEFIDGSRTSITCQIGKANPIATITWTIDSIIQPSTSITTNLNSDGTTTSIFNYLVDKSDNTKTLNCTADNNIGNPRSDSKNLVIKFRPSVYLNPSTSPNNIIKGRELVLSCFVTVSNPPVPSTGYTWKKNDIIIQGQRSDSYRIVTVNIADNGSYTCSAENTVGSTTTTSVTIDVLYGPTLTVSENTVTTEEHSEVRIRCTVKSNPPPHSFIWIKPNDSRVYAVSELVITSINRNQAGVYKCVANVTLNPSYGESEFRTDNQITDIKVLYLDPVNISPSKIINEGDELGITCSTNSFPVATITWYNGTAVLDTREINSGSYTKQDGASCMDSNTYSCKAINTALENREFTNSTYVIVKCSPRQDPRVTPISTVTGNITEVVNLVADVISYPPPSFTWYYIEDIVVIPIYSNGSYQLFNTNSSINTYKSTLKINITSNYIYRTYTVNVSNDDGGVEVFQYSVVAQKRRIDQGGVTNIAVAGGVVGVVLVLAVCITITILLIRRRRQQQPKTLEKNKENGSTVALNEVSSSPNKIIIDEVVDYVSADNVAYQDKTSINDKQSTNSAGRKTSDPSSRYSTVNKQKYSESKKLEVNEKPQKRKTNKQKLKQESKSKDQKSKIGKEPGKIGDVYENVGIFGDINTNPGNMYENSTNSVLEDKQKDDQLVYVDLNFDHQNPSTSVKGRTVEDDAVEYSGIDYTKRGPTPPPDSDSSDEEMGYLPPKQE